MGEIIDTERSVVGPLFGDDTNEDAPVSRSAFLAGAFMERFSERFMEAEDADDKMFVLDVSEFDAWLVEIGEIPDPSMCSNVHEQRGVGILRQEARKVINRSAQFGRGVFPPFSINVRTKGKTLEVRLIDRFVGKLPVEISASVLTYLVNKKKNWDKISEYINSDAVRAELENKPDVRTRFLTVEGQIRLTFNNIKDALKNLNDELDGARKEARAVLSSIHHKRIG